MDPIIPDETPPAVAPAAEPAPALTPEEEFEQAFEGYTVKAKEPVAEPAAPATDPAPEPTPEPAAAAEPAAPAAAEPGATIAPEASTGVSGNDEAAQIAADRAELARLRAERATPPAVAAPVAAPTPAEPTPAPLWTDAELADIAKYKEEWPDIAKQEALIRRGENAKLVQDVVKYVFEQVGAVIAPLQAGYQKVQGSSDYQVIKAAIADYDQVRDPTIAWIETLPPILKEAYSAVKEGGTPDQVIEMVKHFKLVSGYVAPAAATVAPVAAGKPAPVAAKPTVGKGMGISPAAAAAAAKLAPVASRRAEVTPGDDPDDFDAAFAAAIKAK